MSSAVKTAVKKKPAKHHKDAIARFISWKEQNPKADAARTYAEFDAVIDENYIDLNNKSDDS